jgi:lipoprotein NlpD
MRHCWPLAGLIIIAWLSGCASTSQRAPVVDHAPSARSAPAKAPKPAPEKDWRPETYTVKKGDTLHSIGLEFGFDYKEIAQWNDIQPPYVIHIGRQLRLKEPRAAAANASSEPVVTPLRTEPIVAGHPMDGQPATTGPQAATKTPGEPPIYNEPKVRKEPYSEQAMNAAPVPPVPAAKPVDAAKAEPAKTEAAKTGSAGEKSAAGDDEAVDWSWPVNGKVLTDFNDAASAKGIDIGGNQGQAVLAAAAGKVVYSGSGLRGYGKLVIIKHNKTYLSAYAHNSQILVKEGQEVVRGQKIAEMGSSDTDRVKLHFEIRKLGKPVDPAKYLPASPGT